VAELVPADLLEEDDVGVKALHERDPILERRRAPEVQIPADDFDTHARSFDASVF
jgi:hypothetical protein